MSAGNPAAAEAQTLHDDIISYIGKADAMMQSGQFTTLAGLDEAVDALCKRVIALDVDTARTFAPRLQELLTRLDALQQTMQTALDACKTEVDDLDKHAKGVKAYKKGKK